MHLADTRAKVLVACHLQDRLNPVTRRTPAVQSSHHTPAAQSSHRSLPLSDSPRTLAVDHLSLGVALVPVSLADLLPNPHTPRLPDRLLTGCHRSQDIHLITVHLMTPRLNRTLALQVMVLHTLCHKAGPRFRVRLLQDKIFLGQSPMVLLLPSPALLIMDTTMVMGMEGHLLIAPSVGEARKVIPDLILWYQNNVKDSGKI